MENIPITEWKAKYGRIFKVRLENQDIYFRLLTVGEIETYKKDPFEIGFHLDSIILNNKSLSTTGAKYKLSDFVIKNSFPNTDDEMKERVLHNRFKVKDDFVLNLIAKLCSIYISYTPDQLRDKTLDQLLELTAIAEVMIDKPILNDKKGKPGVLNSKRSVTERNEGKFAKPPVEELMDASSDALQNEMAKFGKKVPKLDEVKAKKQEIPLTDLQRQMKELKVI